MNLTLDQKDALAEVIHIGYGRAAAALSAMTHQRVQLLAPRLDVLPVSELRAHLSELLGQRVACVNQTFVGPITGHAMLLFEQSAALELSKILDETAKNEILDGHTRDILTETGNVLLNACLGVFGSMLQVQLNFAVPSLHVDDTVSFLGSIVSRDEPLKHAVVVQTRFSLRDTDVSGALLIVLGVTSLERVLKELDSWQA